MKEEADPNLGDWNYSIQYIEEAFEGSPIYSEYSDYRSFWDSP